MPSIKQTDVSSSLLRAVKTTLKDGKVPYCSGTLAINESNLLLFYANPQGQAARINLFKASDQELERLAEACEPATFGRNNEDVLDESYRKAGKLDERYFSTKLDLNSTGLTEVIRFGLLEGSKGTRAFHAELYKLNVYDKGAFFKAHKDTPRGEKMFGSLVIVFPTAHEGGSLLLRHKGKVWAVDSGQLVAEKRNENPEQTHLIFATFFSDVEHEVTPVKSGYRVTLTYNLYFDSSSDPAVDRPLQVTEKTMPPETESNAFRTALSNLIQEPTFLPEGGGIGFGLYHQYPVAQSSDNIRGLQKYLKGRDAMIMQVCKELSLDANLWLVYSDKSYKIRFLVQSVPNIGDIGEDSFLSYVLSYSRVDVRIVELYGKDEEKYHEFITKNHPVENFVWATKVSHLNEISKQYIAYGNESYLECSYANVCLVVDVGPPGNRSKTSD